MMSAWGKRVIVEGHAESAAPRPGLMGLPRSGRQTL